MPPRSKPTASGRVRGLTRSGYREQVRGFARDARNRHTPCRRLARLMRELEWRPIKARGLNQRVLRGQIRGYALLLWRLYADAQYA